MGCSLLSSTGERRISEPSAHYLKKCECVNESLLTPSILIVLTPGNAYFLVQAAWYSETVLHSKTSLWHPAMKEHLKILTLPKFNSSPLNSYRNPIGKACLPTTNFQGRAVKLRVGSKYRFRLGFPGPKGCNFIQRW